MTTPSSSASGPGDAHQGRILAILSAAALMVMYIETMIVPGLTGFEAFFGNASLTSVTWILTAYLVVGVVATPITGKLGDIYGKKRVLVILLAIYFVAVSIAGFTPDIGAAAAVSRPDQLYLLIAARALQGVGVGTFPLAYALIADEFSPQRVAQARSIVAAMFALGAAAGLVGGAWVTEEFGWQATYHTMIPVSGAILALSAALLPQSRVFLREKLDIPGAVTIGLMLAFFLLALTEGPDLGWWKWHGYPLGGIPFGVPELFALAIVFLIAFVAIELRSAQPIVAFSTLVQRNILLVNTVGLCAGVAMFLGYVGLVARTEVPFPFGLGKTYVDFGLYVIPAIIVLIVVTPLAGRALPNHEKPMMLIGGTLIVLGGTLMAAFNSTVQDIIIGPIPALTGIVMIYISMTHIVILASKPEMRGIATGMNQTFRNIGTSIGPAVGSTIIASLVTAFKVAVPGSNVVETFRGPSQVAFQVTFALVAVLGLVCVILSSLIVNVRRDTYAPDTVGNQDG